MSQQSPKKQAVGNTHTAASSNPSIGNEIRESLARLKDDPDQLFPLLALIGFTLILMVAYWNSLEVTRRSWFGAQYSHGYLVPGFTLALLWMRRQPFQPVPMVQRWCGVLVLTVGLGGRLLAAHLYTVTLDTPTLVICLLGVCIIVGGFHMVRWAGPAVMFLVFMFPLPTQMQTDILGGLQRVATIASTYICQTLGMVAIRDGNVISIEETKLNIVDACSGLRMATIFVALAMAIVLVTRRPWWDRLIILLSSIPIALVVNAIRITVTALLYKLAGDQEWIKDFSHDGAGYFMMPLALGFLYLELQILDRLVIEDKSEGLATFRSSGKRAPVVP